MRGGSKEYTKNRLLFTQWNRSLGPALNVAFFCGLQKVCCINIGITPSFPMFTLVEVAKRYATFAWLPSAGVRFACVGMASFSKIYPQVDKKVCDIERVCDVSMAPSSSELYPRRGHKRYIYYVCMAPSSSKDSNYH